MLAWLAYLTVAVVWGSTYFAIALSLESFTPFGMVAVRFSAASLLALGLGRLRREPWPARRQIGHLTLVGALLLGISNPLVAWATLHGKRFVHGGGLMTNVGIQMLTAAAIGWILAPVTGGFLRGPLTSKALGAIAYLALFGSLLAFSAYIYLAKAWPPAKMGTYAYLNPLVAVLLGSRILHEAFGLREILGMAVILVAVALVQLRSKVVVAT